MKNLTALMLPAILGLAACGGTTVPVPPTLDEIADKGLGLLETTEQVGGFTDPSTLPTSSSASYDGVMAIALSDGTEVAGEMEMNVAFSGTPSIDGRVYNIVDGDAVYYNGELDLGNSVVDRGANTAFEYTYGMEMTGTVTGGGTSVDVDAVLLGDFVGNNHQQVIGIVAGDVSIDNQNLIITDGVYVAER